MTPVFFYVIGFIICAGIGVFLIWSTIARLNDLVNTLSKRRHETESLKSEWIKVTGTIIETAVNTDFFDETLDFSIDQFSDLSEEEAYRKLEDRRAKYFAFLEDIYRYGGAKILYEYQDPISKKILVSRNIGVMPIEQDIDLAYKLNPGDKVTVYLNPKDSYDSLLRSTKEESFQKFIWSAIKSDSSKVIAGLFMILLSPCVLVL